MKFEHKHENLPNYFAKSGHTTCDNQMTHFEQIRLFFYNTFAKYKLEANLLQPKQGTKIILKCGWVWALTLGR